MFGRVRLHLCLGLRRKLVAIDVKGFEDIGHHICTVVSTCLAVRSTCRENGRQWPVGSLCGLSSVERKASYTSEAHVAKMAGRGARGSGCTCGQDFAESLMPSLSRGSNTPVTTFGLSLALVWLSEAHAVPFCGLSSVERKASYTSEALVAKMGGRGARGSGRTCGQDFDESLLPSVSDAAQARHSAALCQGLQLLNCVSIQDEKQMF